MLNSIFIGIVAFTIFLNNQFSKEALGLREKKECMATCNNRFFDTDNYFYYIYQENIPTRCEEICEALSKGTLKRVPKNSSSKKNKIND